MPKSYTIIEPRSKESCLEVRQLFSSLLTERFHIHITSPCSFRDKGPGIQIGPTKSLENPVCGFNLISCGEGGLRIPRALADGQPSTIQHYHAMPEHITAYSKILKHRMKIESHAYISIHPLKMVLKYILLVSRSERRLSLYLDLITFSCF